MAPNSTKLTYCDDATAACLIRAFAVHEIGWVDCVYELVLEISLQMKMEFSLKIFAFAKIWTDERGLTSSTVLEAS